MTDEPNVRRLFSEHQPVDEGSLTLGFVATGRAIAAICATRILLMIAVVTGSVIWGYTVFDPSRDRLYAAIAFSLVFVLPQVLLYFKRG